MSRRNTLSPQGRRRTITRGRLLAVDDEPTVLRLLESQAKKLFFEVTTATNGRDALDLLLDQEFDILLTDIIMPKMDGITLLQEARRLQPDLECIVISGQHQITTAIEAMKQGAINYLQKPVGIAELEAALEKGMERVWLTRQLRVNREKLEESAQRLAEETAKNRMILETAAEGIVGLDRRGRIIFINPAALEMLGVSHDQVLGKTFHTVSRHADPEQRYYRIKECPLCQAVKQGKPYQAEGEAFKGRSGTPFFVAYSCAPIRRNGKPSGAVLTFSDITKQRAAQEELDRYRKHLEELVRARTAELAETNRRLREDIRARIRAEKEAEERRRQLIEADKMASLGILVAGVAHEINNPNNFISINAPLLQQAWQDIMPILEEHARSSGDFPVAGIPFSEMKHHVPELFAGIAEGSERIRRIVLNLRDYARQSTADMDQLFDLNEVVRAALTLLDNPLKKATRHLSVRLCLDLPKIKGNFQRAEQVVVNLIQNAYQSLTDPEQAITITTSRHPGRRLVVFTVEDQGCGIPAHNLQRIQDPFFTTKRAAGGTGLGLSISAGIMEEHGGRLEFRSEPGKGTTARALFPIAS